MKGHIRERSPGHWAIVLEMRDAETGKRKRRWHSFAGTKRQAQVECARLVSELQNGSSIEPSRTTVAQYLDRWLEYIKPQVAPRTHERYSEIVRTYLAPTLGTMLLTKLQPVAISSAYAKMLSCGRRKGAGGLSPRSVGHCHRVLSQALRQAVRWRILSRNPCDDVDPPRVERRALNVWDIPTMAEALELARPLRIFVPMMLAGMLGLRRGEIVALRWRYIDLDKGQIAVIESFEQTRQGVRLKAPKSGRGRKVALPARVIAELRAWRARQAEELLKLGVRLDDDCFVCAGEGGQAIQPQSLTHAWHRFLAGTNLPRVRFHDLRHSHATHMLASGVHPKIASERLGHATVGLTLDTYSHVIPGMQEDAVARIDAAFNIWVAIR
ncbi:MAG TPA: tyrosine-type recombinase/integrase [Pseudolabrys sp.]|jgi:site-specific recombinase XerC